MKNVGFFEKLFISNLYWCQMLGHHGTILKMNYEVLWFSWKLPTIQNSHFPKKCWYWSTFHYLIGVKVRITGREKIRWAISYKATFHHVKLFLSIWKDKNNYTHNPYHPGWYPFRTQDLKCPPKKQTRWNPPNVTPSLFISADMKMKTSLPTPCFWTLIPIRLIHELSSLVFFPQPLPPVCSLECQFKYYIFSNSFLNFPFASTP